MSKKMNTVIVNLKMELLVSDDCFNDRFASRDAVMRYALSSCFRNHTRKIIDGWAFNADAPRVPTT